jgi:hypothetical protein
MDAGNSNDRRVLDIRRSVYAVKENEYSPVYPVRMVSREKVSG